MKLIELFSPTIYNRTITEAAVGREYQHLEDLLIDQGAAGGKAAIQGLRDAVEEPAMMNVKWDGLAAVFWGRDSDGSFYFVPINQWNKGQKLTRDGLVKEIENTGRPKKDQNPEDFHAERRQLGSRYEELWDIFENATPSQFRGYMWGDLMFTSPPKKNAQGEYVFTPNKVTYTVQPNGLMGKISRARVFATVHGLIEEFGAASTGNLRRVPPSTVNQFNSTSALVVLPTEHPRVDLSVDEAMFDAASDFIDKNKVAIDRIANFNIPKLTNFKKVLYDYAVKRAKEGIAFDDWLANSKLSDNQKQLLDKSGLISSDEFKIFWEAFARILEAKHHALDELHGKHGKDMWTRLGIRAETGGRAGGEGYAWAASPGQMVKMVNPRFRSAPDNARFAGSVEESRLVEADAAGNGTLAVWTMGRLNPAHWGHENMIDKVLTKTAVEHNADWFLFVSNPSKDRQRNPLGYEDKIKWIHAMMPQVRDHLVVDPAIKTPLQAATWLYKQGYRKIIFVAGAEDMPSYRKMIESGNLHGEKNPDAVSQGKGYYFGPLGDESFEESPRLASATDARAAVTDGDRDGFAEAIFGPTMMNRSAKAIDAAKHWLFDRVKTGLDFTNQ